MSAENGASVRGIGSLLRLCVRLGMGEPVPNEARNWTGSPPTTLWRKIESEHEDGVQRGGETDNKRAAMEVRYPPDPPKPCRALVLTRRPSWIPMGWHSD